MRWWALPVAALLVMLGPRVAGADVADFLGKTIESVRLELEEHEVVDPELQQIVTTTAGTPLSMVAVRETVSRLFSLGRFEDIRVHADASDAGVSLVYDLVPVHPVDRITFTGASGDGIDTGRLRRDLIDRYGISPPVGRAPDLVRVVEDDLRAEGYLHATVSPHAELQHAPDRATLVFDIAPGERTRIADIEVTGEAGMTRSELLKTVGIEPGAPYRSDALATGASRYVDKLRSRGFFEAKLTPAARFDEGDRLVHLTLEVEQGPRVRVEFRGDTLPTDRREEFVPIEREGSADEDLLEDSSNRIEEFLRAQGYRDAAAPHTREEAGGVLTIVFTVKRGPQYRVAGVEMSGNQTMPSTELAGALRVREGQPFSAARVDADAAAVEELYRRQGFAAVRVQADEVAAEHAPTVAEVAVTVHIDITENVRTMVENVRIESGQPAPDSLLATLGAQAGRPLFTNQLAADRDTIQQYYMDRGYQGATVESNPGLSADRTRANVVFSVHEGPRLVIEHILIVGNVRTKTETIERELQFKVSDPLSQAAVNDTQRRLASLGLFRRIDISTIGRGETGRDVLVHVDEAPVTTIGYGGGVEASQHQVLDENGVAEPRLEFAPRAFFEVGRRNLFGKNRSANLFTRFSLRPSDAPIFSQQNELLGTTTGAFGFAEYRVLGTFREPHVFGTPADAFVTGTLEQQARSSFDFARASVVVETGRRFTPALSVSGNYVIQRVRLFNEIATGPSDQLLIDRAFPQVRLSSFSSSIINSTRNDPVDPTEGTYLSATGQLAARAIGSELGYLKSYMRGQWFHALPKGTVLATNATLGLAAALPRNVVEEDGTVTEVREMPASERFFAGGDTTVRGFALDQLGVSGTVDRDTIDPNGFPIGGNGMLILNAELRIPYHKFQLVTFVDAGNVFAKPSYIDLTELRSAVGFGLRYKSPVGPIRVDLGFKTNREVIAGQRETLTAIHISLGQAF